MSKSFPQRNPWRLCLALRRSEPAQPFQWTAVRGLPIHLPGHWKDWSLFTYRDGPIVYACDYETGLTLAVASTQPRVRYNLIRAIEQWKPATLSAYLCKRFAEINPGPKPKVRLKKV